MSNTYEITEHEAMCIAYAYLDYFDENDEADFESWLEDEGRELLDAINRERKSSALERRVVKSPARQGSIPIEEIRNAVASVSRDKIND